MKNQNLEQELLATAQIYGREMNTVSAEIFMEDLKEYAPHQISVALSRCRKELRHFPSIADIISRIDDGHLGVEEAWAMCPFSESQSVVWTDEIKAAFFAALPLLEEEDPIAARQTFKEVYGSELQRARSERRTPKWSVSLGHDKAGRAPVLKNATKNGWIEIDYAKTLIPQIENMRIDQELIQNNRESGLSKL